MKPTFPMTVMPNGSVYFRPKIVRSVTTEVTSTKLRGTKSVAPESSQVTLLAGANVASRIDIFRNERRQIVERELSEMTDADRTQGRHGELLLQK